MRYLSLALLLGFVLAFVVGCESPQPEEPAKCSMCGTVLAEDGTCPKCSAEKATDAAKEAAEAAKGTLEKAVEEKK